jgi:hypothetical protein
MTFQECAYIDFVVNNQDFTHLQVLPFSIVMLPYWHSYSSLPPSQNYLNQSYLQVEKGKTTSVKRTRGPSSTHIQGRKHPTAPESLSYVAFSTLMGKSMPAGKIGPACPADGPEREIS